MGKQTWAADAGTDPADVPQQRDAAADGISARREKILFSYIIKSYIISYILNITGNMSHTSGVSNKKWYGATSDIH